MSTERESAAQPTLEPASSADFDAVFRLLSENNLPVADIEPHLSSFVLAKCQKVTVGSAGLELYGRVALLRSLCVAKSHRARRIGATLVSAAEALARRHGVRELYLLTVGAAAYFGRFGFTPISREHAPLEIRSTSQFSLLCPSSALCMRKVILPSLEEASSSET